MKAEVGEGQTPFPQPQSCVPSRLSQNLALDVPQAEVFPLSQSSVTEQMPLRVLVDVRGRYAPQLPLWSGWGRDLP